MGLKIDNYDSLSEIEKLIVLTDLTVIPQEDEAAYAEALKNARKRLAMQLGGRVEDIEEVVALHDDWDDIVIGQRVKRNLNQSLDRDNSWDRLESAVLIKLNALVENNLVVGVSDLLAIAKAANSANRPQTHPHRQMQNGQTFQQFNQFNLGNPDEGLLPSGHLGTVRMSLASRVVKQLQGPTLEGEVVKGEKKERLIDSVEMLSLEDIQESVSEAAE